MKLKFSNKLHFSRRVVLVFATIVAVPLFVLFSLIIGIIHKESISGLEALCNTEINMHADSLYKNIETYDLMEKMVIANNELVLFMSSLSEPDEEDLIRIAHDQTQLIERTMTIVPSLYSVRIFSDNSNFPERFPVFLKESRTNLAPLPEWSFEYKADFMGLQSHFDLPSVCRTKELKTGRRHVGYVQVSMTMEDFFPFLSHEGLFHQNDYAFYYSEEENDFVQLNVKNHLGEENLLSDKDLIEFKKVFTGEKIAKNPRLYIDGDRNLTAWRKIPELNLIIVHACSTKMVIKSFAAIVVLSLVGFLFVMICFYIIVSQVANRMFRGLYSVMDGMKQVHAGNLGVQLEISGSEEVRQTLETFNEMTQKLTSQIEQIKTEQQLIADTEMKAMQNQINAHFLYNVLETIHMQAVLSENEDVAKSILMLGKMMRYCLRWRIHTVSLEKEMEYIQSYVSILNIRNDYEVKLKMEIPDSQKNLKIPKMIIQPFVENSFIHGIEPLARDTIVKIYTELDEPNQKIWLCVEDFGKGMEQSKIDEILSYLADEKYERDSTGSIGIKNIQQRLFMFYGSDYKLQLQSTVGKGTLVRIPLPIEGDTRQ